MAALDYVFVLLCTSAGILLLIMGLILKKLPPKNINDFYGYRTSASMKSPERWEFAQKYAATETIKLGAVWILITLLIDFGFQPSLKFMIILVPCLIMIGLIQLFMRTEKAIRRKFPE